MRRVVPAWHFLFAVVSLLVLAVSVAGDEERFTAAKPVKGVRS